MRMETGHLLTTKGCASDYFKQDNVMKIILERLQDSANVISVFMNNNDIVDKSQVPASLISRISRCENQLKCRGKGPDVRHTICQGHLLGRRKVATSLGEAVQVEGQWCWACVSGEGLGWVSSLVCRCAHSPLFLISCLFFHLLHLMPLNL